MARGAIGQNTTYAADWERASRGVIDAAKVSRPPFVDKDGSLVWYIYTKGTPEDAGTYTVVIPKGCTGIKPVSSPAHVVKLESQGGPGTPITRASVQLDAPAPQLALRFPAGTDLTGAQVLRPGYDAPTTPETGHWTREYVADMKALNPGVIRSMDWLRTNGSKVTTWDSRCKVEDDRWNVEGKGGPIEPLIELCNAIDADLWFNVPHGADDEYVALAARMIRDGINPKLAIYVEYSNEVWNTKDSIGQNTAYCKAQGVADPACDGPNDTVKCRQWYAKRAMQVAWGFFGAFIVSGQKHRVRPVLSGQAAYPEQLDWSIAFIEKIDPPFSDHFYGIAVSPYFGNTTDYAARDGLTLKDFYEPGYTLDGKPQPGVYLIDRATAYLRSDKGQRFFAQAKGKGVKALAYEGGLGIKTKKGSNVIPAVCADPRIGEVMRTHFDEWFNNGGDAYCHFVAVAGWDDDSSYGASDRITATPGPKAAAIGLASASRPLPYAEPPPDPRDVRIKELETSLGSAEAALSSVRTDRDVIASQLNFATGERDRVIADRDRLASKLSAIQQIANAQ